MKDVFNADESSEFLSASSKRLVEAPRGSVNGTSCDLDDTIVSARLQDLSVERRLPKDAAITFS